MTQPNEYDTPYPAVLNLLMEYGFDGMAEAMTLLLNEAMKAERSLALGASPSQRTEARRGYANGYKPKRVQTRVGELTLAVPQVRPIHPDKPFAFYPSALERGLRSDRALSLAVVEMYVQGVSTRRVQEITKELCGLDSSSTQVSRAAKMLDEHLSAWRKRDLGEYRYLMLDARYEKVRISGVVRDCAVLVALGVDQDGKRSIVGVSESLSEAEVHWRDFFASLQDRGLHGVKMVTSDDHKGLKAALQSRFPNVPWQRCQVHLQRNASAFVPKKAMRAGVASDLKAIFTAKDLDTANTSLKSAVKSYEESAPELAAWMEENVPEGFTVFTLPPAHHKRLRTTNVVERLNQEIKRRTRVVRVFPNEESLLRLVTAIVSEISDEWESGNRYLTMNQQEPS